MELTVEQTTNSGRTIGNVQIGHAKGRPRAIRWSQIAGFVIFGAILLWVLWDSTHGYLTTFFMPEGAALVLGCTGALLLATFGGSGAWQGIKTPLTSVISADEHRTAVSFFQLGAVYALASGLIGLFIGVVTMFRNLGGDMAAIGGALALALLTQFYGVILAVVFLVLAAIVSRRAQTNGTLATLARRALPIGVGTAVVGTLACILLPSIALWR